MVRTILDCWQTNQLGDTSMAREQFPAKPVAGGAPEPAAGTGEAGRPGGPHSLLNAATGAILAAAIILRPSVPMTEFDEGRYLLSGYDYARMEQTGQKP